MYKFGLLLLVTGVLGQHQVTQQIQPAAAAPERQIRLEDIETDGLKSSAAQQSPQYHQQPAAYQQQPSAYQQQPGAYQQQQQPALYQQQAFHQPAQALYQQHFQIAPAATALQAPQYALHPAGQQLYQPAGQQLYQPAAGAYQQQYLHPLYLQPQAHPTYNVPLMIIPYHGLQQELIYPGLTKLRAPVSAAPAAQPQLYAQPQQQANSQQKFRPSPQVQYPSPYSSQVYQQKFATGVKSTPAPTVKDNYVQQQSGFNYKLQ